VLASGPAPPARSPAELKLIELEGKLAQDRFVYLALDPEKKRFDVRVRGVVLEQIPIEALGRLVFEPFFGSAPAPPLRAPAIWRVEQGPGDTDRELIAPTALRPYPKNEQEEAANQQQAAKKSKPVPSDSASTYRVKLDNGWQLYVLNELPETRFVYRYWEAIKYGWARLRGEEPAHPPLLAVVLTADNARRLHHLFRSQMPILVGEGVDK